MILNITKIGNSCGYVKHENEYVGDHHEENSKKILNIETQMRSMGKSNADGVNMVDDIYNCNEIEKEIYRCSICKKKYETNLGLRRHIVRSHSKELLLYECKKCGKKFRTRTCCNTHKCREKEIKEIDVFKTNLARQEKLLNRELNQIYDNIQIDEDTLHHYPFCKLLFLKHNLVQNHNDNACPYCGIHVKNKYNSVVEHATSIKCKMKQENIHENLELDISEPRKFILSDVEEHYQGKDDELYGCAKCSHTFSSQVEIKKHVLNKECKVKEIKEKVSLIKQKYLKTLRILEKAKLNREKLKNELLALGENLNGSDSDSDDATGIENFINLRCKEKDFCLSLNKINEENATFETQTKLYSAKFKKNLSGIYGKTENIEHKSNGIILHQENEFIEEELNFSGSEVEIQSEPNEENICENQEEYTNHIHESLETISFETFIDLNHQNNLEIKNNENDQRNTFKNELIEESLDEEFLVETYPNEKFIKTENINENEENLQIGFFQDQILENECNSNTGELYEAEYIDECTAEEWIDTPDDLKISSQPMDDENNKEESIAIKNEIDNSCSLGKYNEKFMSFLYKSLMKKELQRDKIKKDLKRQQKEIYKLSEIQNKKQQHDSKIEETKINTIPILLRTKVHVNRKSEDQTVTDINNKTIKHNCSYCGKTFPNRSAFDAHRRSHTCARPYKCSYCERRCYDHASLDIHERRHTNDRRYKCEFCDEKFFTLFEKKRHQKTWHQKNTKKKLKNVGSLRHNMSYDQKRQYGPKALLGDDGLYHCKMCDQVCLTAKTMRKHTALHLNGKACPICSKVFAYESTLERHLRVPHEEKNYMCTVCGNRYVTASSLKAHSKVHSENAIKCPLCPKIFGTVYNFDRHMIHKHKLKNWQETYTDIDVTIIEEE